MTGFQNEKGKNIIDTHRHPFGKKLVAKMADRGMFDPQKPFPQTNSQDIMFYREFLDLDFSVQKQREGGVTKAISSNGGEIEWAGKSVLGTSPADTLKFINDENLEIRAKYPNDFEVMANAHALEKSSLASIEEMIDMNGARAIAVASSYGQGKDQRFLDSPDAEWLWEYAEAKGVLVHIHPPMSCLGAEALKQYRLIEAIGRPFDSTVNAAKMICSGVFDRYPNLKVLVVHMGGDLASVLGRLEFNWNLNYNGVVNPPAEKTDKNLLPPSEYFKRNIYVDTMGFNPIGVRAAIEMCGIDRVVLGTDFGPVPYGIEEHIDIVNSVISGANDREKVLWKTSNEIFRLGLEG